MRFHILNPRFTRQRFYEWLLHKLLRQMGYGTGGNLLTSGELPTLEYVYHAVRSYTPSEQFILFDVGANVGAYTSHAIKIFDSNIIIHAFEPEEKSWAVLSHSTAQYKSFVHCHRIALGVCAEKKILFSQQSDTSTAASFFKYSIEKWDIPDLIEYLVDVVPLDLFCESREIEKIHLLKLDVEGYEYEVLQGATKMLQCGAIDWIQFEFSDLNIESHTHFKSFWDMLQSAYNIYRILPYGLYQINSYKPRYELYQTANFLAERRRTSW